MNLSRRMLTICGMVEDSSSVIDVGCDHALVDIYLAKFRNVHAIAADINENALKSARKNIKRNDVEKQVEVVCTDGLDGLDIENKTILICGMGTKTIIDIIKKIPKHTMKEMIIQTNHDLATLRKFMRKHGFRITEEKYLVERKKHYVLIKFVPGKQKYRYMDDYVGPLLKQKEPDYLKWLLKTNQTLLEQIPGKYYFKRVKLACVNRYIEKELEKIS